jgi:ribosomal protein S18 acetylase RimI-like enzyme
MAHSNQSDWSAQRERAICLVEACTGGWLRSPQMTVQIRAREPEDDAIVERLLCDSWGDTMVVSRGRLQDARLLPGFIAVDDGAPVGLVTYRIHDSAAPQGGLEMEVVTIDAVIGRRGTGSALLQAAVGQAMRERCRRLWLITTNDNVVAQRFYEGNGMTLAAVHGDALDRSRELKPGIPSHADNGVPIRDEWEYELLLDPDVEAPRNPRV